MPPARASPADMHVAMASSEERVAATASAAATIAPLPSTIRPGDIPEDDPHAKPNAPRTINSTGLLPGPSDPVT